jgi:hypothetical protein
MSNQITPNPNPSGSTISVTGPDEENLSSFENNGTIVIDSTLSNFGILNSNAGSLLRIGGTLNNFGTLNSAGKFAFVDYSAGVVNNYNTFTNANTDNANYFKLLNNCNTFTNSGFLNLLLLQNTGEATNNSGATLGVDSLSNTGTLSNSGTIVTDAQGTITNSGALDNSGTLHCGMGGTLNNSGLLNNSGTLLSGLHLNNSGNLNNSGTLQSGPAMSINNSGTVNNSGAFTLNFGNTVTGTGTYIQTAGQTVNNGNISQSSIRIEGGSLSGTGTITGNLTIGSGASVNPGNSPGTLTVNGDVTSDGALVFEIAGLDSGLYDMLNINGNANFTGGHITVNFINGFHAAAGNHWDFLSSKTISGWDKLHITVNGLGTGLGWTLTHSHGKARLSITSKPVHKQPH